VALAGGGGDTIVPGGAEHGSAADDPASQLEWLRGRLLPVAEPIGMRPQPLFDRLRELFEEARADVLARLNRRGTPRAGDEPADRLAAELTARTRPGDEARVFAARLRLLHRAIAGPVVDLYSGGPKSVVTSLRVHSINPDFPTQGDLHSGFYTSRFPSEAQERVEWKARHGQGPGEIMHFRIPQVVLDALRSRVFDETRPADMAELTRLVRRNHGINSDVPSELPPYDFIEAPMLLTDIERYRRGDIVPEWGSSQTVFYGEAQHVLISALEPEGWSSPGVGGDPVRVASTSDAPAPPVAFGSVPAPSSTDLRRPLRVATITLAGGRRSLSARSLDHGDVDLDYWCRVLSTIDADVVTVAENEGDDSDSTVRRLAEPAGYRYISETLPSPSHLDPSKRLGIGIMSRLPIDASTSIVLPLRRLPLRWRGEEVAMFDRPAHVVEIGGVRVVTAFPMPLHMFGYSYTEGPGRQHAKVIERLARRLGSGPVIIAGDFNTDRPEELYRETLAELDLHAALPPGTRTVAGRNGGPHQIFASSHVRPIQCGV
jgi:endonuclease/exonuclease/phosphatase family metal-dependent hydrolase